VRRGSVVSHRLVAEVEQASGPHCRPEVGGLPGLDHRGFGDGLCGLDHRHFGDGLGFAQDPKILVPEWRICPGRLFCYKLLDELGIALQGPWDLGCCWYIVEWLRIRAYSRAYSSACTHTAHVAPNLTT